MRVLAPLFVFGLFLFSAAAEAGGQTQGASPRIQLENFEGDRKPHVVIVSGLGESESDYKQLRKAYGDIGFAVSIFVPASEANQFDGDFEESGRQLRAYLRTLRLEFQPRELHLIGHSMGYGTVMEAILGENVPKVNSITFSNPMLTLEPLYSHEAGISSRSRTDMIDLQVSHTLGGEREHRSSVRRSVGMVFGYEALTKRIEDRLTNASLPPTRILLSEGDQNIDHRRIADLWGAQSEIVSVASDRHNLLRRLTPVLEPHLPGIDFHKAYRDIAKRCLR